MNYLNLMACEGKYANTTEKSTIGKNAMNTRLVFDKKYIYSRYSTKTLIIKIIKKSYLLNR